MAKLKCNSCSYNTYKCSHSQYCAAPNCNKSRGKCPNESFFRFPKSPERCKKWIENCRRPELLQKSEIMLHRNYVLCSAHFEDTQFMNLAMKNKLTWNAVPTLFEVPNPLAAIAEETAKDTSSILFPPSPEHTDDELFFPEALGMEEVMDRKALEETKNVEQQSEDHPLTLRDCIGDDAVRFSNHVLPPNGGVPHSTNLKLRCMRLSSMVLTPTKLRQMKTRRLINQQRVKIWRLKKQVQALKRKVQQENSIEAVIEGASKYMSGLAFNFFANQLRLAAKKKQGKRWVREDKLFALSLNYVSSEAYDLCSKVFHLPTNRTIQRWWRDFREQPEFEERILKPYMAYLQSSLERDTVLEVDYEANDGRSESSYVHPDGASQLFEMQLDDIQQSVDTVASVSSGDDASVTPSRADAQHKDGVDKSTVKKNTIFGVKVMDGDQSVLQLADGQEQSLSAELQKLDDDCELPLVMEHVCEQPSRLLSHPKEIHLQLHSDSLSAEAFQFIANAEADMGHIGSEETVMFTSLPDGINLQIVTLGASEETVNILSLN